MNMEEALHAFVEEASELIDVIEHALLKIEEGDRSSDILNELFRAAHTIKGSAGLFGLESIVNFTHDVENVLDRVRDNEITVDEELLTVLFKSADHIAALIADVNQSPSNDDVLQVQSKTIQQRLSVWLNAPDKQSHATKNDAPQDATENRSGKSGVWHISLRMPEDALVNGMDPLAIIRYLSGLAEVAYVGLVTESLPAENFKAENLYLGFEIGLKGDVKRDEIEEAFMFVEDEAEIVILSPEENPKNIIEHVKTSIKKEKRIGEILVECGAISGQQLEEALGVQKVLQDLEEDKRLGEILIEKQVVDKEILDLALKQQSNTRKSPTAKSIRVDANRLDRLIKLIGELIVSRQRIDMISDSIQHRVLDEAVNSLSGLMEQVRDAALNLRMVPVGDTFQRFKRVVRDTAEELGKQIELKLFGEETELDRSMVEKLVDPLTHIVRNAIDHGIEASDERQLSGKPVKGVITLSAFQESGNICIEIKDDGGGLNAEKIRQKAIEKGLIKKEEDLSEKEIHQLIFHPGFSTASAVTSLSGRGVGMDVVKRNIEELQGSVDIESQPGKGSTFTILLPLTLAIIDGFHVASAKTHFIVPQNTIVECVDFASVKKNPGGESINFRGEMVPYVKLSELFTLPENQDEKKLNLLVVKFGSHSVGIVVEEIYGELQTVVKPMNPIFSALRGVGGSSLMGDGEIAFIIDVPQIIAFAADREKKQQSSVRV